MSVRRLHQHAVVGVARVTPVGSTRRARTRRDARAASTPGSASTSNDLSAAAMRVRGKKARDSEKAKQSGSLPSLQDRSGEQKGATNAR